MKNVTQKKHNKNKHRVLISKGEQETYNDHSKTKRKQNFECSSKQDDHSGVGKQKQETATLKLHNTRAWATQKQVPK